MQTPDKTIDHGTLRRLVDAGARVGAEVIGATGGWGVVTADAITRSDLELLALPADLLAQIDTKLPPRWSRNNPVDLAGATGIGVTVEPTGGSTTPTLPIVMSATV